MADGFVPGLPLPPSAVLLGWTLRSADAELGTIEVGFELDDRFLNPGGTIQGGFLAAMLDDTQGPAIFTHSRGRVYAPTIDYHVTCIRPARPGKFVGRGRVVSLGKTIAVCEAEPFDDAGELIARGTFVGRVVHSDRALAAEVMAP